MLENQTANKEQSFSKQFYRPDVEPVRLVNNRRIRISFVANQQDLFQVPASVSCSSFGVASSFEASFVDDLALWLFS